MPQTTTPAAATNLHPPAPGQHWSEQNAWYAGIVCKPDGTAWHLLLPDNLPELPRQPWGEYSQAIEGADCAYDGQANTAAMAAAGNALALAVQGQGEGCYLPSRVEALALFASLQEQLTGGWHWTSTQDSAYGAFVQDFEGGNSCWTSKGYYYRVRAVRRIPLQPFNPSALEGEVNTSVGGVRAEFLTTEKATQGFEAWETRFRDDPASFMTEAEVAQMEVASVSEQRAIYFMALLREVSA